MQSDGGSIGIRIHVTLLLPYAVCATRFCQHAMNIPPHRHVERGVWILPTTSMVQTARLRRPTTPSRMSCKAERWVRGIPVEPAVMREDPTTAFLVLYLTMLSVAGVIQPR